MFEKNIKMNDEMLLAIDRLAKSCKRNRSEGIRCCIKKWRKTKVGKYKKVATPTNAGGNVVTVTLDDNMRGIAGSDIRLAIAWMIDESPEPKPGPVVDGVDGVDYLLKGSEGVSTYSAALLGV